jgi:hypothetical protein
MCARSAPDTARCVKKAPRKRRPRAVDGRTTPARRYASIVAAFTAEIGGGDLSESDRALVAQAATMTLRAEQLAAAVVAGKEIDDDQLVRLSGQARRLLASISSKAAERKPNTLSLADHLARRAAELATDDDGDE